MTYKQVSTQELHLCVQALKKQLQTVKAGQGYAEVLSQIRIARKELENRKQDQRIG